jgi:osmotically-inducible protein OsmY
MDIQEKELKQKVEKRINGDDRLRTGQVKVEVTGNSVKLEGRVDNYSALRAAQDNAYFVSGVKTVSNFLRVEPSQLSAQPDDLEIESNIRNIMLWDNRIDSTEVEIVVDHGQVELDGSVYSFWEKQLASDIVLSVQGVRDVQNNLMVNTRHDPGDELMADRIFEALDANPFVNAGDIDVAINNGLVTLSGTVQNYLAATEAHDALLYIQGVRGINNQIDIG